MKGVRNNFKNAVVKKLGICQLGHCVFCLRKLVDQSSKNISSSGIDGENCEHLREVPEALSLSPNFLKTLNGIWPYMQNSWNSDGNSLNLECVLGSEATCSKPVGFRFPRPPKMCEFCASKVQAVDDLLTSLRLKIEQLRAIITKSKKEGQWSWRGELFESNLKTSSLNKDVITSTLKFFNALGGSQSSEAEELEKQQITPPPTSSLKVDVSRGNGSKSEEMKGEEQVEDEDYENNNGDDSDPDYIKSEEEEDDESMVSMDDLDERFSSAGEDANEDGDPLEDKPVPPSSKKQKLSGETSRRSVKDANKAFPCILEDCDLEFESELILNFHLEHSHRKKQVKCSCGLCFSAKIRLWEHHKTCEVHLKERESYRCARIQNREETCHFCGVKLAASKILEHVQDHIGDYVLKCPNDACIRAFSSVRAYLRHGKLTGSKSCKEAFKLNSKFDRCEACGFKKDAYLNLRTHLERFHERGPDKKFKCPVPSCEKTFCVRQSVHFHLDTHSKYGGGDTTLQKCEHCNEKMKPELIEKHLKVEHEAKEEIIKCGQCPFLFSSPVSLMEHLFAHRLIGMYCHLCNDNVKYTRHRELREHYHTIHQVTATRYLCEHCSQAFWKKESLSFHLVKKHSKDGSKATEKKRFPCDTCQMEFSSEYILIAHKIKVHGESPFSCSSCRATFVSKVELSRHEKEHAGILIKKEFHCEVPGCDRKFPVKKSLTRHIAVHHSKHSFVCDICGKSYFDKSGLKTHHETFHLKLRPCVCEECGESFASTTVLKRHKRIHTGERPFTCNFCDQKFRHKEVLRRHLEGHEKKGLDFKPNGSMKQIRKRKGQ